MNLTGKHSFTSFLCRLLFTFDIILHNVAIIVSSRIRKGRFDDLIKCCLELIMVDEAYGVITGWMAFHIRALSSLHRVK